MEPAVATESTRPAEVVVAHGADHVRTAAELLDQCVALGTIACFHTNMALLPRSDTVLQGAGRNLTMGLLPAEATRALVAVLTHKLPPFSQPFIEDILAPECRAEQEILTVLCNCTISEEAFVFVNNYRLQETA